MVRCAFVLLSSLLPFNCIVVFLRACCMIQHFCIRYVRVIASFGVFSSVFNTCSFGFAARSVFGDVMHCQFRRMCFTCWCVFVHRCFRFEAVPTGTIYPRILFPQRYVVLCSCIPMFFAHAAISFPMQMFSLPCSGYNVSFCKAFFTIVFVLTVIKTYVDKNKRVECIAICLGEGTYTYTYVDF